MTPDELLQLAQEYHTLRELRKGTSSIVQKTVLFDENINNKYEATGKVREGIMIILRNREKELYLKLHELGVENP